VYRSGGVSRFHINSLNQFGLAYIEPHPWTLDILFCTSGAFCVVGIQLAILSIRSSSAWLASTHSYRSTGAKGLAGISLNYRGAVSKGQTPSTSPHALTASRRVMSDIRTYRIMEKPATQPPHFREDKSAQVQLFGEICHFRFGPEIAPYYSVQRQGALRQRTRYNRSFRNKRTHVGVLTKLGSGADVSRQGDDSRRPVTGQCG
jgi:hypothetical protein